MRSKVRLAAALAAAIAVVSPNFVATAAVPEAGSESVELVDPRTLAAPDAPDPIVLACDSGQIDLNHASVQELRTLPTPDGVPLSTPVAKGIISSRPFLQPTDLRAPAVEGVTSDHVTRWVADDLVCVTPIFEAADDGTNVPVTPDECEDGEHDVNDAADDPWFAATFGRPSAQRIVDGSPFPSVINALRIAGVGPGNIKKYSAEVCATPWPMAFDGTDWAWAYPEVGITADTTGSHGVYDVVVPAGTTSGTGAWASIAEVPTPYNDFAGNAGLDLDLPAVDPHIHQDGWAGQVAVVLPEDTTNVPENWTHGVFHWPADGGPVELHGGSAVPVDSDGRVRVATDDLSIFSAVRNLSSWLPDGVVNAVGWAENLVRGFLGVGGQAACNPDHTGQTLDGGENLQVTGALLQPLPFTPPLNTCTTRDSGNGRLDARFGNGRGVVFRNTSQDGVSVHDVDLNSGAIATVAFGLLNRYGSATYVPPGGSLNAHTTAYQGTLEFSTSLGALLTPTLAHLAFEELLGVIPSPVVDFVFGFADCIVPAIITIGSVANNETAAVTGLVDAFTTAVDCYKDRFTDLPTEAEDWLYQKPTAKGTASKLVSSFDRIFKWTAVAKAGIIVADVAGIAGADGTVTLRYKPPVPPTPATDSKGRAVNPSCVSKTFSYDTGWTVTIDETCQDLSHREFPPGDTPGTDGPPVDANADFDGKITNLRMYDVLRRDAAGVLHLIRLEGGDLVAHPIASGDEWSFKQDWPEDEWRSAEFDGLIDRIGSPAVNDPLLLRNYLEGRGGSWLLREADGTAWYIDENGTRYWLPSVEAQQAVSNTVLTYHPAQYANDVCPYDEPDDDGGLRVC